jgi:hypothetical protein
MRNRDWAWIGVAVVVLAAVFPSGRCRAQNGIWSYNSGGSAYAWWPTLASNGDLLTYQTRFSVNGSVVWRKRFDTDGTIAPFDVFSMAGHGSGVLGAAAYMIDFVPHLAVLNLNADGVLLEATEVVDPSYVGGGGRIFSAPDGGFLLLSSSVCRFNAGGELLWARQYAENEWPQDPRWTPDGGFYAVSNGSGVIRYDRDGFPVRVLTTAGDQYNGINAIVPKHSLVFHQHRLYIGISAAYQESGAWRVNTGLLMTDTMGAILGVLMNQEAQSAPCANCIGAYVTVAESGGRLAVGMAQTVGNEWDNYLLECDTDLADATWYQLPGGNETFVRATYFAPDNRVVLVGKYNNRLMQARYLVGSDMAECITGIGYVPAPLSVTAHASAPGPVVVPAIQLELLNASGFSNSAQQVTLHCDGVGLEENPVPLARVFPIPADDRLCFQAEAAAAPFSSATLSDAQGRIVRMESMLGSSGCLSVQALPAGCYTIKLVAQDGTASVRQVLIQH